ncbi:MAG: hypothetical protein JKY48_03155, partial [Flavobacteriales bacterium]|nr:hypothetical protein [Flavobacteriales bacterium]
MKEGLIEKKEASDNIIEKWSIGIYKGDSPFKLKPIEGISYPMISRNDVSDIKAHFVADPFMIKKDKLFYLFFEVLNDNNLGEIALSTSKDGIEWTYEKIVLSEEFHLSYPNIFEWENEYYMTPETLHPKNVRLYKAKKFPY